MPPLGLVFDRAPRRIYWETTRACTLACRHCRAEAMPVADPRQLHAGRESRWTTSSRRPLPRPTAER